MISTPFHRLMLVALLSVSGKVIYGQLGAGSILGSGTICTAYSDTRSPIGLEVQLGNAPTKFMLDSGAPLFISQELQAQHSFPVLMKAIAVDGSGLEDTITIVTIDTLRIGPMLFSAMPCLVLDLNRTGLSCHGITGNLGSNALRFLTVDMDPGTGHVCLSTPEEPPRAIDKNEHPMRLDDQFDVWIPILVNEQIVDSAHFDSGASAYFEFERAAMQRFIERFPKDVVDSGVGVVSYGVHGPAPPSEQVIVAPRTTTIAGSHLERLRMNIADDGRNRIGRGVLAYGRLRINYPAARFSFHPYARRRAHSAPDHGVSLILNGREVRVGTVWRNSRAERSGAKQGDQVLTVDGVDLSAIAECEMEKVLREILWYRRVEFTFTSVDDGSIRNVRLKRRQEMTKCAFDVDAE